jgi:fucose permease
MDVSQNPQRRSILLRRRSQRRKSRIDNSLRDTHLWNRHEHGSRPVSQIDPRYIHPAYRNTNTNPNTTRYGTTFGGWLIAALTNSTITQYLDLGPILCLGAAIQILAHALRVWEPPFALYVVTFFLASLGQAYNDTHANTFVSSLNGAHRYLGFIHAMYMAGCLVGPFVATGIASANVDSKWYLFYLFPLGVGLVNLALLSYSFRDCMAAPAVLRGGRREGASEKSAWKEIKDTLSTPGVWLVSLFFFFFLGATITAGGMVSLIRLLVIGY